MMARTLRWGARIAGGVALAALAACNNGPAAVHGAPVLTSVYWVSGDATSLVWTQETNPQAALVPSAPPFVSEVDFVFDRRLDGARIEDTFTDGGVVTTGPMSDPPIHVTFPDAAVAPTFAYTVQYNSLGRFGDNTSYVFLRPSLAGVPSGETMTFDLDPARLTGAYGEPLVGTASVSVSTTALGLSVSPPSTAVSGTYQLPLAFSNRMPAPPPTSPFIHVRGPGDVAIPYGLVADANLASRWFVVPAACLGRWPARATFTVVVDPGLPDAFGGALLVGTTATFQTSAGTETPSDCGAPDASATDAADASAGDADGTAGDAANADGTDGDAADASGSDGDAADADGSDAGVPDAGALDATASS